MRTIRWGVWGTGAVSDDFCADLELAPGVELRAVASRQLERAEQFARRHGAPLALTAEALLAQDLDVIYVATPPALHREHAIACMEAGKSVLLEKPFARTAQEARDIVACARRTGRFCMEAMWLRFVPAMRQVVQTVRAGRHGPVRSIEASLGFPHGAPQEREEALLDLGVYPLSFIHSLLGPPQTVRAVGDAVEVTALLGYPQAHAVMRCSHRAPLRNDALVEAEAALLRLESPLYRCESYSVQPITALKPRGERPGGLGLRTLTTHPQLRRWVQRAKAVALPRATHPALGIGYTHQIIEVNECLRQGVLESNVMSLDESVSVMETVDAVRGALL